MMIDKLEKHFERRSFTARERGDMQDLYTHAKMFAQHLTRVTPECIELELAVLKIKEALALSEMAVTMNPTDDQHQVKMPFVGDVNCEAVSPIGEQIHKIAKNAHCEIDNLLYKAAHARR